MQLPSPGRASPKPIPSAAKLSDLDPGLRRGERIGVGVSASQPNK